MILRHNSVCLFLLACVATWAQGVAILPAAQTIAPSCRTVILSDGNNNAEEIASKLDKLTETVTARAGGPGVLIICGDDRKNAVGELATAAKAMSDTKRASIVKREPSTVRLFFNRNAADVVAVLKAAFPKLAATALNGDVIALGAGTGEDAAVVRDARRWISAMDVPRPEVSLTIWSAQASGSKPDFVDKVSTSIRAAVAQHNGELQEALRRGYGYLYDKTAEQNFYATHFRNYVRQRFVAAMDPGGVGMAERYEWGACGADEYCLGYAQMFELQPSLTSMLFNVVAADGANRFVVARDFVDCLEGQSGCSAQFSPETKQYKETKKLDPSESSQLDQRPRSPRAGVTVSGTTRPSTEVSAGAKPETDPAKAESARQIAELEAIVTQHALANVEATKRQQRMIIQANDRQTRLATIQAENKVRYADSASLSKQQAKPIGGSPASQCEESSDRHNRKSAHLGPGFACFRAALYDAIEDNHLHLLRTAIADFLFEFKYATQYPLDFDSGDNGRSSQYLDTQMAPILTAFNRDVARYLEFVQTRVEDGRTPGITFSSNGVVTIRTLSALGAQVAASTQNKFSETPTLPIGELLTAFDEKSGAGIPPLTTANLITAAIRASAPSVATLGRSLTLKVTSNSLPGASAAELKLELETKDEPGSAKILRGSESKDDPNTRVASHSVNTNVRVDSLKLFQVSSFAAELRRGRKPFPLLPPYVELPGIGSLVSLPMAPSRTFHRSFAIVSAVVLPTAADLASGISFSPDTIAAPRKLTVNVRPQGTTGATYTVVARVQGGAVVHGTASAARGTSVAPIRLSWSGLGQEARYDVYALTAAGVSTLLASNLKVFEFIDQGKDLLPAANPLPSTPGLLELQTISPASFLSASVPAYHLQMLKLIEKEAKGESPLTPPVLSSLPAFRY